MNKKIIIALVLLVIVVIIIIITIIITRSVSCQSVTQICKVEVSAIIARPALFINNKPQRIPRVIIQTNQSNKIPKSMDEAIQTILDHNPEYSYKYFDDRAVDEFLEKEYGSKL